MRWISVIVILLASLLHVSWLQAQPSVSVDKPEHDVFIHDWSEDELTVTVTNREGQFIKGLNDKDFIVRDSTGVVQVSGAEVSRITDAKSLSLSFVLDNSASIFAGYDSITKYLDGFIQSVPGDVLMGAYVFDNRDRTPMHEPTRRGQVYIASSGETESRDSISRFWHYYDSIRVNLEHPATQELRRQTAQRRDRRFGRHR
jgi:hypothetical protein